MFIGRKENPKLIVNSLSAAFRARQRPLPAANQTPEHIDPSRRFKSVSTSCGDVVWHVRQPLLK